jgi:hypothetical protein
MTLTTGLVVAVISLGVSSTKPAHETTHLSVNQRPQHKVVVIGHQLITEQLDFVHFQPFGDHTFKGSIVFVTMKDRGSHVGTVEGVVKPSRFVCAAWSWHARQFIEFLRNKKEA